MSARLQRRARGCVNLPRLGEHNHTLSPGARIAHAEYSHAPLSNTRNLSHGFFDFLRIEMTPRADDDVLDASGDKDVASCHIRAVAAVQRPVLEKLAGFGFVLEIATSRRGSSKLESPLVAVTDFMTRFIDNTNLMVGQRLARCHDFKWLGIIRFRRLGNSVAA